MTKKAKESYGNYIINNKNEILKRKKKILRIKRTIILLIVLSAILITLCFTLPIFNLQEIIVDGTKYITSEQVKELVAVENGTNIFKIQTKSISGKVEKSNYVLSAKVKRKYPNKLTISIDERDATYYIIADNGYYIIDDTGVVLEKRDSVEDMLLIQLSGIDESSLVLGHQIEGFGEKAEYLAFIFNFIKVNNLFEQFSISKIEVNNFVSLKLYINDLYLNLGTMDNLFDKLSKGFNLLNNPDIASMKGYVDISFEGNPVIYKEE